jgi:hypothetical protein
VLPAAVPLVLRNRGDFVAFAGDLRLRYLMQRVAEAFRAASEPFETCTTFRCSQVSTGPTTRPCGGRVTNSS